MQTLPHRGLHVQRRYSVAKIDSPIGYEGGKPKAGGLSDPRLGTMDRGQKCTTDGASSQDSPGYFGHIELAKPVYHIGFISTVVKVLRCVSYHSSKLLVSPVSPSSRLIVCCSAHSSIRVFLSKPSQNTRALASDFEASSNLKGLVLPRSLQLEKISARYLHHTSR